MRRVIQIVPAAFVLSAVFSGQAEAQVTEQERFQGTVCRNIDSLPIATQKDCRTAATMCFFSGGNQTDCINRTMSRVSGPETSPSETMSAMDRCRADAEAAEADAGIAACTTVIGSSAQSSPERARGFAYRAVAYLDKYAGTRDRGVWLKAAEDAKQATAIAPKMAESYLAQGLVSGFALIVHLPEGGDPDPGDSNMAAGAIENLTQAIPMIPRRDREFLATAFLVRGWAYDVLKQYDRAIQDFSDSIKFKPDFATAYYVRARIETRTGNSAAAAADFRTAKKIDPKVGENTVPAKGK